MCSAARATTCSRHAAWRLTPRRAEAGRRPLPLLLTRSGPACRGAQLFDVRTMREVSTFKQHKREITALAWHPVHPELFVSGGFDGTIYFWSTQHAEPLEAAIGSFGWQAHESAVWSLAWHPLGHLLASGSNDHAIKFWCRSRPGDGKKRAREDEDKEEEARAAATLQPDAATLRCNPTLQPCA